MPRKVRSSRQDVFLGKGVLKMCSKFTGEHPCRSVISIKFLCNFTEIALRHVCSPVNLLHIFRTSFPKNTSAWLLLENFQAFKGNFSDLLKTCTNIDPLILIISVPKIFDRLSSNFSLMFRWSSLKNRSLVSFLPTEICVIYLAFDKMTALLALQHEIPFCTCIYLKRQQILVNP